MQGRLSMDIFYFSIEEKVNLATIDFSSVVSALSTADGSMSKSIFNDTIVGTRFIRQSIRLTSFLVRKYMSPVFIEI